MRRAPYLAASCLALELSIVAGLSAQSARTVQRRQVRGHPLHYLISRPNEWAPTGHWPAIVIIPDAYREFDSTEQAFTTTPGAEGFVIVTPLVLSGGGSAQVHRDDFDYDSVAWRRADAVGNCAFDETGIRALLADLADSDHVTTFFLTGWEAGGHVVLAQALDHPERWAAAAAATPNYIGRCVSDPPSAHAASALRLPLRIFHGSEDSSWSMGNPLYRQWAVLDGEARARGFVDVTDVAVPGPHGPLAAPIVAYFRSLVAK